MRCVAVISQKDAAGKTTVTANLGHALARAGHKVTLIDLDPQGCLTNSLGLFNAPFRGVDEVLLGGLGLGATIQHTRERLDLVPAGQRLADVENLESGGTDRAKLLFKALSGELTGRDFVLFDCPTSSALLLANAIVAADEVLIPVSGDLEALEGLNRLTRLLARFRPLRDRDLRNWVVRSRIFPRRRLTREVSEKLLRNYPEQVLATSISEAVILSECSGTGRTIFEFRESSQSARAFKSLALDLVESKTL